MSHNGEYVNFAQPQDRSGMSTASAQQLYLVRIPRPPLSQFTTARRVWAHIVSFVVIIGATTPLAAAVNNRMAAWLSKEEAGDFGRYIAGAVVIALALFLGGVWWQLDAHLARAGKGRMLRLIASFFAWNGIVGLAGGFFIALLLLTLVLGNPDAPAWMASYLAALLVIGMAGLPALLVAEAVSGRSSAKAKAPSLSNGPAGPA